MRDSCKNDTQSDRVHEETHNGLHSDEQSSPVAIVGGAVPITYTASLSSFRGRAYSIDQGKWHQWEPFLRRQQ